MRIDHIPTTHTTTMDTDVHACDVDAEAISHVMRLLSNQYGNVHEAVLREYAINALDSHRAAKNPDPIRVTLPTPLSPTLIIADNGVGLDKTDIINTYARYGPSTKRDTNDQVGGLGIGSKSAFALGAQFAVTGIKNGVRTQALFSLNHEGQGTFRILDETHTTEPNGVTITITINDVDATTRAAPTVFSTWPKGTVTVDEVAPDTIYDTSYQLDTNIRFTRDFAAQTWHRTPLTIVMGCIAYPVAESQIKALPDTDNDDEKKLRHQLLYPSGRLRLYVEVGVGEVDIAPSREALRDTRKTLDKINHIIRTLPATATATVQAAVDKAPTYTAAAIELSRQYRALKALTAIDWGEITWNGQERPSYLDVPHPSSTLALGGKCAHNHQGSRMEISTSLDKVMVVTGVTPDMADKAMKHAKRFCELRRNVKKLVYVPESSGEIGGFRYGGDNELPTISYRDYRAATRTPRSAHTRKGGPSRVPTYHVVNERDAVTVDDLIGRGLPLAVFPNSHFSLNYDFRDYLRRDNTLVVLRNGQTIKTLKKRVAGKVKILPSEDAISAAHTAVLESIIDHDRKLVHAHAYNRSRSTSRSLLKALVAAQDRLTNPAALAEVDAIQRAAAFTEEDRARSALLFHVVTQTGERALFPLCVNPKPPLFQQFPLLETYRIQVNLKVDMDHVVAYLNAATAAHPIPS